MNIYTKKGDFGNTTLLNVNQVSKDDKRIHLLGNIDELNSILGVLKSLETSEELIEVYEEIQRDIMLIMAGIADNHNQDYKIPKEKVDVLEERIDNMEAAFPREKRFVLPGKTFYTAQIDVARTVVRRCERYFVGVTKLYPGDQMAGKYINRLSDYLYVLARYKDYKQDDLVGNIVKEVIAQINLTK